MVSVIPASRYVTSASFFQSSSWMYDRDLIPRNSTELSEAVPIAPVRLTLIAQKGVKTSDNIIKQKKNI